MSDWVGEARRRHRRRKRLKGAEACVICGRSDLCTLRPAEVHLVEQDHVFGRQRDPITRIALCRNHHAILTDERRDLDIRMPVGPDPLEELAVMLRSVGRALTRIGNALVGIAEWILDLREYLLDEHPDLQDTLERFPSTYQLQGDDDD